MSIWKSINNTYERNFKLYIDGWETTIPSEEGKVIAKINTQTKKVKYIDKRAIIDEYAQSIIKETIENLIETQRTS
jgi:hypothetical protein